MDEFTRQVFRNYIAKVAAEKFSSISDMALDIAADAAIHRLTKLAHTVREIIEHSGRTEPNGFDVFDALYRYRESIKSLAQFVVDKTFDGDMLYVPEYPVEQSGYYGRLMQDVDLPFRAGMGAPIDTTSDEAMPHVPRFLPSPFGEHGLQQDDESGESTVKRRSGDRDAIMSAVRAELAAPGEHRQTVDVKIDCPLVEQIVKSVVGETGKV